MSPTAERLRATLIRRLRPHPAEDEGFTLIEVLAAMLVFALASSATVGMLVTGLRASLVAKLDTGAKNLAQERVEMMRNLPFHIDFKPGLTVAQSMDDLLNHYYTNTTAAADKNSTGYVAACGAQTDVCAGREAYEPQSGSFYRRVFDPVDGYPKYRQYVSTQFVDVNRTPLGPRAGYDSLADGADNPASQFVFVSVMTLWTAGTLSKSYLLDTYVAAGRPAASRITLQARGAALALSVALNADALLQIQAGTLSLDGAFGSGTLASGRALGAFADISSQTGSHVDGALAGANAPPNDPADFVTKDGQSVVFDGRKVAGFLNTSAAIGAATVTAGLPNLGDTHSRLVPQGPGQVGLALDPATIFDTRLRIDQSQPVAWVSQTGSGDLAHGAGSLSSKSGATHNAEASVGADALAVHLFPTSFAPDGVVRIRLSGAALKCATDGTTGGAAVSLTYSVRFEIADGAGGYVVVDTAHDDVKDPLAAYPPDSTRVGVDPFGRDLFLSDYVTNWGPLGSAGVAAGQEVDPDGNKVTAAYPGVASVTTIPLRNGDPTSGLSLQLGQLSCTAEDNR